MEPMTPASASGFLTTGPPGTPFINLLNENVLGDLDLKDSDPLAFCLPFSVEVGHLLITGKQAACCGGKAGYRARAQVDLSGPGC